MTDAKTVQRKIRPITIRCGAPGCTTKQDAAVDEPSDGGEEQVIAPRGWTFKVKRPESTRDVVVGLCPLHSKS